MSSRSTLPSAILALLWEGPKHPYRIQRNIRERHKDEVINVSQRASVYQAIRRLEREGLIRAESVSRDANRPEKTTYGLTEAGRAEVASWLRRGLARPLREFPEFPAVLSFLEQVPPEEARTALVDRVAALEAESSRIGQSYEAAIGRGVPRLVLVEYEYLRAMIDAEAAWAASLVAEIEAGTFIWSPESIRSARESRDRTSEPSCDGAGPD